MKNKLKKIGMGLVSFITAFTFLFYSAGLVNAATVTIDSAVSTLQTAGSGTATTPSFSPGANTCIAVFTEAGGTGIGTSNTPTNTGTALTWAKRQATLVSTDAYLSLYTAFNASAQAGITVTQTNTLAGADEDITAITFGSVDTTGTSCSGAIASSSIKSDLGGVNQPSIVQASSARNGDYFTWSTLNETSNNALTAGSNQTIVHDGNDTVDGFRYVVVKQNAATPTAGTSVTDNGTWATAWTWGMINLEMQPAAGGGGSTPTQGNRVTFFGWD
jgi:hypothetical protein